MSNRKYESVWDAIEDDPDMSSGVPRIKDEARDHTLRLYALATDETTRSASYIELTVTNQQEGALQNVAWNVGAFGQVNLIHTAPESAEFAGVALWASDTDGFSPSLANLVSISYDTSGNVVFPNAIPLGTTYYFRAAAFDKWGKAVPTYTDQGSGISNSSSGSTIYYATTAPAGQNGDLWFDTDDGNHPYWHNGTIWVDAQDNAAVQALAQFDSAGAVRLALLQFYRSIGSRGRHAAPNRHDHHFPALRGAYGDGHRRSRHARRRLDAQQLFRLGGSCNRIYAQQ